ncbi:MAG TPA: primosomal protein N', partial [Methylophilaceae bacterium]|nr:primosomal protein N' [Methylophilaceae bacterium]
MQRAERILKVALDVPLDTLFDYLDGGIAVEVGQRVIVAFGRRKQIGIVADIVTQSDIPVAKLKPIEQAFVDEVPLGSEIFKLLKFCADYYQYPLGQALLSVLPGRLRQLDPASTRIKHHYSLTLLGREAGVEAIPARSVIQRRLHVALQEHGYLNETALAVLSGSWRKAMRILQEAGWVETIDASQSTLSPSRAQTQNTEPLLNADQSAALAAITENLQGFKPWL